MQQCGGFKLQMKTKDQAEQVFPIIKEEISSYECWSESLMMTENTISIDPDVHIATCDYPGVVVNFCKAIASAHPDFEYSIEASCSDDEGNYSCSEKGYLRNGKFNHIINTTELADNWDDFDPDDIDAMLNAFDEGEENESTEEIVGEALNGVMQFKSL